MKIKNKWMLSVAVVNQLLGFCLFVIALVIVEHTKNLTGGRGSNGAATSVIIFIPGLLLMINNISTCVGGVNDNQAAHGTTVGLAVCTMFGIIICLWIQMLILLFSSWSSYGGCTRNCVVNASCTSFYSKWYGDECCDASGLGDGWCDLSCNVTELNYDEGDCLFCTNTGWCPDDFLGDGYCDEDCNIEECGYDDGDCDRRRLGGGALGGVLPSLSLLPPQRPPPARESSLAPADPAVGQRGRRHQAQAQAQAQARAKDLEGWLRRLPGGGGLADRLLAGKFDDMDQTQRNLHSHPTPSFSSYYSSSDEVDKFINTDVDYSNTSVVFCEDIVGNGLYNGADCCITFDEQAECSIVQPTLEGAFAVTWISLAWSILTIVASSIFACCRKSQVQQQQVMYPAADGYGPPIRIIHEPGQPPQMLVPVVQGLPVFPEGVAPPLVVQQEGGNGATAAAPRPHQQPPPPAPQQQQQPATAQAYYVGAAPQTLNK